MGLSSPRLLLNDAALRMPTAEALRLADLAGYGPTRDDPDPILTRLVAIVARALRCPIAGVSLVDDEYVWIKARVGVEADCLAREGAFCAYAVDSDADLFHVSDTRVDPRFAQNALVVNAPQVRMYAAAVLRGPSGYALGTLWVMGLKPRTLSEDERDMLSVLSAQAAHLLELRHQNPVSQLPSRRAFIERVRRAVDQLAEARGGPGSVPLAVGYIALRNFALVRSAYGVDVADRLLLLLAQRLRAWIGPDCLLAHLEGNHIGFALLNDTNEVAARLGALEAVLSAPVEMEQSSIHMASVVGVSASVGDLVGVSALLDQAEVAAAAAVPIETRMVYIYQNHLDEQAKLWGDFQRSFPQDLARNRVFPVYQPQIDVQKGSIAGFEALARYRHEKLGVVGPSSFLELAGHAGLLRSLDFSILGAVCSDLVRWRDKGLDLVPVSVNFSRCTLKLQATAADILQMLGSHGVAPNLLVVEVLEDGESESIEELRVTCEQLIASGVRVAMDDFGVGRSNLGSLLSLHLDYLKVDRRFVHEVSIDDQARGVLRLIAGFAEISSMRMVCEGVEYEADLQCAMEMGCVYFQGWYFSKAVDADTVERMLSSIRPESGVPAELGRLVRDLASCTHVGTLQ